MEWEAKKIDEETWGSFLVQKYCRTDEPVCYGVAKGPYAEDSIRFSVQRLNDSEKEEHNE